MTFVPGETVGPYRIIDQLGQGGMATVFKAYHTALDRYVAIKVLNPAIHEDPGFISRFQREARIVAKLDHPNIIPIYDFAIHEGTPYLVMRYIEGQSLKTFLHNRSLPPDQVLTLVRPVVFALAYAHSRGVLHRDIKPSNIILADDGQIFLADFGLARMMQAASSTWSQDALVGTPQYISPEQAKGESLDRRTDVYTLGVVLFEMLTGRVPFCADTPYAIIHDQIYSPPPLPSSINPNISPEVEAVLLQALAKDPQVRFESVTDLLAAFERAACLQPTDLSQLISPRSRAAWTQFHPAVLAVVGGLLFVGLVFAIFGRSNGFPIVANTVPSATASTTGQSIALATVATTEIATPIPSPTLTPTIVPSPTPSSTPTNTSTLTPTQTPIPPTPTITPTPTLAAPRGMVLVPASIFWMGASPDDGQAAPNEIPGHQVEQSAFVIDKFEVSNEDYRRCVDAGVCTPPKGVYSPQSPTMAFGNPAFDDLPVVYVTQGMASQYCTWLGKRLPYEAEWEKAARGSIDQRIYPWGNIWEGERANAAANNPGPVPVTIYNPKGCSPAGACNMSGNVAEWVADFYGANFYADSIRNLVAPAVIRDPINWDAGSGRFAIRGGSFKSNPFDSRVSKRDARPGGDTVDDVGFRCAQSVPGQ